jgi:predicted alpha/beta superfamily hydrolase
LKKGRFHCGGGGANEGKVISVQDMFTMSKRIFFSLFFIFCLPFYIANAVAAPDLSTPVGPTVADAGSDFYQFNSFKIDSYDGNRHYRITIAIPQRPAPSKGYPVIYLLDGNAALASMDDSFLKDLGAHAPVLVFLGYQTELRFDVAARARDFTPPGAEGETDYGRWQGGGAADFLQLITEQIQPELKKSIQLDPERVGVWGHSFGGLFVLYALQEAAGTFQYFASAAPSLWWMEGAQIDALNAFISNKTTDSEVKLLIMHGEKKKTASSQEKAHVHSMEDYDATAVIHALSDRLNTMENIASEYAGYPLTHGPLFAVSLKDAIVWFSSETSK